MALTKKGIAAKVQLAEIKKRELEKAKSLGWAEDNSYSAKEIIALHEKHCSLVCDHILTYKQGGAHWQLMEGHVADLAISPVLRMVDDAFREPSILSVPQFHDLMKRIGVNVALAVNSNDAEFFHQLALVIEKRANGGSLTDLKPKDLGLKASRGRKKTPLDLSRVFPLSLVRVIGRRLRTYASEGEYRADRVTRQEICDQVQTYGATISESELSRWIKRFEFSQFMEEQPIAQKRPKKG
ncbi:hypothetical protein N9B73_06015 [Verrucomicrobiales bacterium]|nr:hypothetical protein [Verrucomicrobiales bacterium]